MGHVGKVVVQKWMHDSMHDEYFKQNQRKTLEFPQKDGVLRSPAIVRFGQTDSFQGARKLPSQKMEAVDLWKLSFFPSRRPAFGKFTGLDPFEKQKSGAKQIVSGPSGRQ